MTFEYGTAAIKDLTVSTKSAADKRSRRSTVAEVHLDGEPLRPTERFWTSLFVRYGFNKTFFNYFTHEEVFQRIAEKSPNDKMRFCIHQDPKSSRRTLLAVSNPTKSYVPYDDLRELLETYGGKDVSYANGIVESRHTPRMGATRFHIAGDEFANQFILQTPIDGFGQPSVYLSLLREICSNGMVGMGSAFRSQVMLGKGQDNPIFSLIRVLDGFGNDDGYAALRQRFDSAAHSWASVREAVSLYNLTARLLGSKAIGGDGASTDSNLDPAKGLLSKFHNVTGDVSRLYGLANLDAFSAKRQRTLPVNCKVYDLLNFATEVATHHAKPEGARRLQAWVGSTISDEYDMEGTADAMGDFRDFFIEGGEARKALDNRLN